MIWMRNCGVIMGRGESSLMMRINRYAGKYDIDCPESMLPADDNGVRVSSFWDERYAQALQCRAVVERRENKPIINRSERQGMSRGRQKQERL